MLYWRYSENRIFFLNEYWILIPTSLLVNYLIIRKIRSRKKKIKELKEGFKHDQKLRRILYLAIASSDLSYLLMRGGADIIDVDYINSGIDIGISFLNNERLKNIIHDLYSYKRRGRIIYITATALCHLANRYGTVFLAFPFAIGDFGLTNLYQGIRKAIVTILLGGVGSLYTIGGPGALTAAVLLGTAGLRLAFNNLDFLTTTPIYGPISAKDLQPRIPNVNDVVVINSRDKIIMTNPIDGKRECFLPEQAFFNSGCKIKGTEIPNAIDLASHDLDYNDVVNMQDVTGLDRVEFTDRLDLGQVQPSIPKTSKGKMVNFLDKFGDSGIIDETDTWDASESMVPERKYLRSRNEL